MTPLSGCDDADPPASSHEDKTLPEVTLTQADSGKAVTLGSGMSLQVSLNENPSTGFRWSLDAPNDEILEMLNSDYVPATGPGLGGGGQHVWRFRAKNTGEARLILKLWRSWEGDQSIVERLEFTIRVKQ